MGGARFLIGLGLAAFASGAMAQSLPPAGHEPPASVHIPLHQRPDRSGFSNFMTVQVGGGPPANVLFDTGSTGLRIRAEAVGPQVKLTSTPLTYAYSSGNVLKGVLGYALVSFPGSNPATATVKPIAVHVVQSMSCKPDKPKCPGWLPGEMGVMGTAYSPLPVFNPLAQLPGNQANGFIVVANDVTDPGVHPHVVAGLTPHNSAGFARAPFGPPEKPQPDGLRAWNTKGIQTCFSVNGGAPGCRNAVFDTGAASGTFTLPGMPENQPRTRVPQGQQVRTEIPGVMSLTVLSGDKDWLNRYHYQAAHGSPPGFNSGAAVFRHYRVLFDGEHGQIGFLAPGAPNPAR